MVEDSLEWDLERRHKIVKLIATDKSSVEAILALHDVSPRTLSDITSVTQVKEEAIFKLEEYGVVKYHKEEDRIEITEIGINIANSVYAFIDKS